MPPELVRLIVDPVHTGLLLEAVAVGKEFTVTANAGEAAPFEQLFVPITVILPEEALVEKLTVIEFVFDPDAMDAPVGRVHV